MSDPSRQFQAHLSLPCLPMDAMEDDGTAVDRGPRGSGAWLACPRYEKSHDPLMKTLHEPVTCVKILRV